ncbi:MAG: hypothetical protein GF333_05165 [Candidatus Omnitrophica bacterium]|nr:hypothetical protein [Candidatus Omnitrophota bacterium]
MQLQGMSQDNLWWPPNKGELYRGEQKLTREKLLQERERAAELPPQEGAQLQEACKDFESFFLYYLLKEMDKSVDRERGLIGDTRSMQIYREMWYEQLAEQIAERGMGLQDALYEQVQRQAAVELYNK